MNEMYIFKAENEIDFHKRFSTKEIAFNIWKNANGRTDSNVLLVFVKKNTRHLVYIISYVKVV